MTLRAHSETGESTEGIGGRFVVYAPGGSPIKRISPKANVIRGTRALFF